MCHKEVLGHGDEIWALTVVGDKLVSGSIDRYCDHYHVGGCSVCGLSCPLKSAQGASEKQILCLRTVCVPDGTS